MSRDTASTSSELLRDARFSSNDSSSGHGPNEFAAPTSSQLLAGAAALHPLAGLNNGDLDYLLLDDSKLSGLEGGQTVLPSRGWSDELCYGTGTTYLAGVQRRPFGRQT
jgi:import inner membrane translocase subunit TIM23